MKIPDEVRKIKVGRALFATVGFRRVYSPGKLRITQKDFLNAVKLEPQLYDIVESFLDGDRDNGAMPEYDHEATKKLLYQQMAPQDALDNLRQFKGHPSGDEFANAATVALKHLQAKIPARMRTPRLGMPAEQAQPSRAELITFRRHVATIEDPTWAVKQLLSATLGRDHIEALSIVWPDVLEAVAEAAKQGIAKRVLKDPAYRTTRRIARQLSVLLNTPDLPQPFVRLLQATFAREAEQAANAQPTAPQAQAGGNTTDHQTLVQRIAEQR